MTLIKKFKDIIAKIFGESKINKGFILGVATFLFVLIIFQAGRFVGFHQASFSCHLGDNYYRLVDDPKHGFAGGSRSLFADLPGGHGSIGKIVRLELPALVVAGPDNVEKTIIIDQDTIIHKFREDIKPADLKIGDQLIVLGQPNGQGQIEAKLIRLLPVPVKK